MKNINKKLNRLRTLRAESKLTLAEVAKILDIEVATVSRHESGDRGLTQANIQAYSKLYKVDSLQIFMDPAEFAQT